MLGEPDEALLAHSALYRNYPQFDFEQFAAYFPIAHAKPMKRYRHALAVLTSLLTDQ